MPLCECFDRKLFSIIHVGLAFIFIFLAYTTTANVQKTVLSSLHDDDKSYNGDGYVSLAIIYAMCAVSNWFAPSVISVFGPKGSMMIAGVFYACYIYNFLYPKVWLLYLASGGIGLGAGLLWTGQGNYLTLNSTKDTLPRNAGIFWAMIQVKFFGNTIAAWFFRGKTHIDSSTRRNLFLTLSCLVTIGYVLIFLLLPAKKIETEEDANRTTKKKALDAFIEAVKLFFKKRTLLLNLVFFYTGVVQSFFGVHNAALSFTMEFGNKAKLLNALAGVFIGIGEILGGILFGSVGKFRDKVGRNTVCFIGFFFHGLTFVLAFLNLPNRAPFKDTTDKAIIKSNEYIAMFCAFSLGFGDGCVNTHVYDLIGTVYSKNTAPAFAIYKFMQCLATSLKFFGASYVVLYFQLGICMTSLLLAVFSVLYIDFKLKKEIEAEEQKEEEKPK